MNLGLALRAASLALAALPMLAACGKKEPALPPPEELEQLASATTLAYAEAIQGRDPARFYQQTSPEYQRFLDLEQFKQPFNKFVEKNADLTWVRTVRPTFSAPPQLFANGGIRVEGFFAQNRDKVEFVYEYEDSTGSWKITAMDLHLIGPGGTIP